MVRRLADESKERALLTEAGRLSLEASELLLVHVDESGVRGGSGKEGKRGASGLTAVGEQQAISKGGREGTRRACIESLAGEARARRVSADATSPGAVACSRMHPLLKRASLLLSRRARRGRRRQRRESEGEEDG